MSLDASSISLDDLGKLSTKLNGSSLNENLTSHSLASPSNDDGGAVLTMPSVGLTGPDIKEDLQCNLKSPDVNISAPQLNTPSSSLDGKRGNVNYKAPKFTMPHFNLPQLKLPKARTDVSADVDPPSVSGNMSTTDLGLSKLDLKGETDLKGPDIDLTSPNVNIETTNPDIEAPSGKIKWPHLKWKGPKVKAPEVNINADMSATESNLPVLNAEGALDTPDVDPNLPQANIKGPDVDSQVPNLDIDAPSGKFNWPHLKWKKPVLNGPKADLNANANPNPLGDINAPDIDLNLQKAKLNGPDVEMPTSNIDGEIPSGKINWPHLKWRKPKGPKTDLDISADQNTPNLNLPTPGIKSDATVPTAELNFPKADVGSGIDLQTPDNEIDAASGQINWPHLKWKKPKLNSPKTNIDVNADLSTPEKDLSVKNIESEISALDGNLNLPKVDVDVNAPNKDLKPTSAKFKWPTLKKAKRSFSEPRVKGPDLDFDNSGMAADVSLTAPKIDGGINGQDANINISRDDLQSPKLEVNAPHIESPSGKFKFFSGKKPKFGTLKGQKADLDTTLKAPDVNLEKPDLNVDMNFSVPKVEGGIDTPDLGKSSLETDVNANGPELPDSKIKLPRFKLPTLKKPNPKTPELDAGLKAPDTEVSPNVNLRGTNLSLPEADLKTSDVILKAPEVDVDAQPKFGLTGPNIKGHNVNVDPHLETPDLSLSLDEITKGLNAPDLKTNTNLTAPDNSINLPDLNLPESNLKLPDTEFKAPDLDMNATEFNLSAPKNESEVGSPGIDISIPGTNDKSQDTDKLPDGRWNLPKFNLPSFKGSKVKGPELEIKSPDTDASSDISPSNIKGNSDAQDVEGPHSGLPAFKITHNLDNSDLKMDRNSETSKTDVHFPDFNLSTSKMNVPDSELSLPAVKGVDSVGFPEADIGVPDFNLKAPDLSLSAPNIAPDVTLKAPDIDNKSEEELKVSDAQLPPVNFDSHLGDLKLPQFSNISPEVPSFDPSVETRIEEPKVDPGTHPLDVNISVPESDLAIPKVEGDVKGSKIGAKPPEIEVSSEKSKLQHFNLPNMNFSPSTVQASELGTTTDLKGLPDANVKCPGVEGEVTSPHVSSSVSEVETNLSPPELDISAATESEVKDSPKSKIRWPFKWGIKSGSGTDEESAVDSETEVSNLEEIPAFKFHKLPRMSIDGIGKNGDSFSLSKLDTEAKDYIVSKGIRLPIVNATSKTSEKVDIMERLKMAKENAPLANSPDEAATDSKLSPKSLDVSVSAEAPESSLASGILDESDKLSLSLSNMLGLNTKDSDAE